MLSCVHLNCNLGMMVFEESGKLRVTREKSLGADQQASSISVAAPGLNRGHIDET